jgi:hypothetical protein
MKKSAMNRRKQMLRRHGPNVEHGLGPTPAGVLYLALLGDAPPNGSPRYDAGAGRRQSTHQRRRRYLVATRYGQRA